MFHNKHVILAINSIDNIIKEQMTPNDSLQKFHYYSSKQMDPPLGS
jgi:hypothetical protein